MINFLITEYLWFKQFFQEKDGKPSAKRLWSTILICVFVFTYMKVAISSQLIPDIPDTWALLIGGIILGIGVIDKMKGKSSEVS